MTNCAWWAFCLPLVLASRTLTPTPSQSGPALDPENAREQPHRLSITTTEEAGMKRFEVVVLSKGRRGLPEIASGYLRLRDGEKPVCGCELKAGPRGAGVGFTFTVAVDYLEHSRFSFSVATVGARERKKLPSGARWAEYDFTLKELVALGEGTRKPGSPPEPKSVGSSPVLTEGTRITFDPKSCKTGRGQFFWALGSVAVKVLGQRDGCCVFEYTAEVEMGWTVYEVRVPVDSGPVVIEVATLVDGTSSYQGVRTSFPLRKAKVLRRGGGPGR